MTDPNDANSSPAFYVPDLGRCAGWALDAGARWAAALFERTRTMRVAADQRGPSLIDDGERSVTAVWAHSDGGQALASTIGRSRPEQRSLASRAAELADAASAFSSPALPQTDGASIGSWTAPVQVDPFTGPGRAEIGDALERLVGGDAGLVASVRALQRDRWVATSTGADVEQHWVSVELELRRAGRVARRHWLGGPEHLATSDALERLVAVVTGAGSVPAAMPTDVVLAPDVVAVVVGELWAHTAGAAGPDAFEIAWDWAVEGGVGSRSWDDRGVSVADTNAGLVSAGLDALPGIALPDLRAAAGSRDAATLELDAWTLSTPQRWRVAPDRSALWVEALGTVDGQVFPVRALVRREALDAGVVATGSAVELVPLPRRHGLSGSALLPGVRVSTGFALL